VLSGILFSYGEVAASGLAVYQQTRLIFIEKAVQ
jgi:hypothetical protein